MKTKRLLCAILTLIFLVGMVGISVAAPLPEKVTFQAAEITDPNIIQVRLDNGITDDPAIKMYATVDGDVITDNSGHKWKVVIRDNDVKWTAQKLKEIVRGTELQQDFVVYSSAKAVIVPMETGSNVPISDQGGGINYFATLDQISYVSWQTDVTADIYQGGTAYKFSSTKAKLTRNDAAAQLYSLRVGQHGEGYSSTSATGTYSLRTPNDDVRNISGATSGTWYSVSADNTNYWWWVKTGVAQSATVGGYAGATVKRGTSTQVMSTQIYRSAY